MILPRSVLKEWILFSLKSNYLKLYLSLHKRVTTLMTPNIHTMKKLFNGESNGTYLIS